MTERSLDPTIVCPSCQSEFPLTRSLAAPLIAASRREIEGEVVKREAQLNDREASLRREAKQLAQARQEIAAEVAGKLEEEREHIRVEERRKVEVALTTDLAARDREIKDLNQLVAGQNSKLEDAQAAHAELLRKQRALDDERRELELTIEKRVGEAISDIRAKARAEAEDSLRLKVAEKEETITSMQRQIEDLRRRAEQGSQQLQGEVLELELETVLQRKFPHDTITPVPKGEFGGDAVQTIRAANGQDCGTILWESKRTRNWNDGWLVKLRDDQRAAKADIAILVSNALPKGVTSFDHIDGIWVTEMRCMVPMAVALRQTLIGLASVRQAFSGQETKMSLVYDYLTGPRFRHRIEAIIERFTEMQDDLDRERKAMTRLWAKREAQIHGVIASTAGLYGDLQGIAGRAMADIEALDLLALKGAHQVAAE